MTENNTQLRAMRQISIHCEWYLGGATGEDARWVPRLIGIVTTRTVLSGLPEMSRLDVGLKRRTVGGNSWALRIVSSG